MLEEGRIIGTRAQRVDGHVVRSDRPRSWRPRLRVILVASQPGRTRPAAARRAYARRRATCVSGSVTSVATPVTRCSRSWLPSTSKNAAAVAVGIDIENGLLLQLVVMRLGPFGRTDAGPALRRPSSYRRWCAWAASRSLRVRPSPCASASSATWPDSGSLAPNTQPS